jgi:NHLM bacteriocin system ABC transporter peptidase/ATP-binding protein
MAEIKPKNRRVRTPTILQMEAVECGAAALAIVLAHYGRYVPLEELRVECGVSRDGSKASNIIKAARKYGMQTEAYRKEPESLRTLPLPLLIHWKFCHFLVVEGFGKDKVYLNDPAVGPTTVSYDEFNRSFTGIVLSLTPGADFAKGGQPFSLMASLRQRLQGSYMGLLFVCLVGLSLVIPGLLVPAFSRIFVDYYLGRGLESWLVPLLVAMALTAALRAGLMVLRNHYLLKLETRLAVGASAQFFWHVLRLPLQYYFQRYTGDISSRVMLNDQIAALLSGRLATTFLDILSIIFYGALMFGYDPLLAIISVIFAVANILVLRYVSRSRVDLNLRLIAERSKLDGVARSGLSMIETLKATGRESDFFTRWAGYHAKASRSQQELSLYDNLLQIVPTLLTVINTSTILALGGWRVLDGQLTPGQLVAFQTLMFSFLTPINQLVSLGSSLQDMVGNLRRLDDVLKNPVAPDLQEQPQIAPLARQMPKLSGALELRNLSFGYSRLEAPLIEDFNLTLLPGQRVALIGGSGSGKSTVAKLVVGLYEPWRGEILFDGKRRDELPRSTITNSLATVDQDIFLFEGSVKDNLTLWNPTIGQAQFVQAAKDAHIHNDITLRAGGYDSGVAEDGTNFSGGQRQRLEIARALTANPVLLVLDEATSALDPTVEKQIDENLRRRGCTCLIIAHRLSTIRDCDEIIVMERGKIVQRGTHNQMKNIEGPYARLIAAE